MLGAAEMQRRVLRAAQVNGESIVAVHYASGNLYKAKDNPVSVTCISITRLSDGATEAFSLSDIKAETVEERERELLTQFFSYLSEHPDAKLVHWNMDKADYGFSALASRYKWLLGEAPPATPPSDRLFDLDEILTATYGEGYVPHPKLSSLAALNRVNQRYWMQGKDEADKAEVGDFGAIQRSTSEKSRAIANLFIAWMEGTLVTSESTGAVEFAGQPVDAVKIVLTLASRMLNVERSLKRRHAKRPSLEVNDEYDVQDLLRSLLVIFFDDVREETWAPEYAGGSSRIDFTLPEFNIAIEVKKSRDSMTASSVGGELIIDRDKYAKHPNVSHLVCVVLDHEGRLANPRGLEKDLSRDSSIAGIAVTVRIVDR